MKDKKFVSKKELWMYALGAGGQGMIYAAMSGKISDYYTNVLQLPLMFVLILMLAARIWDAVNDPMMGMLVDRKSFKSGRMRPYIIIATPIIAVLTILMFLSPNLEPVPLMVFTAVVYVLWGMAYTMADVPFWSLPNVLTPNSKERSDVISFTKIINSIGSAFPEIFFAVVPVVVGLFISEKTDPIAFGKTKYLIIAILTVAIGGILYINSYFHIKEKVVLPDKKRTPGQPGSLSRIFKCKPLMLVVIMGVLSSGRYLVQAAAIHVARYSFYIGPEITDAMTLAEKTKAYETSISLVNTIFLVCTVVGMFGTTLIMPKLMRKFDYKKIVITTCLAGFVASVLTTVIGYATDLASIYVLAPFIVIQSIPLGVINVVSYAMICDSLDYMELTTGHRENGLGSACQGFINKIGNAFATSGIIVLYMVIGMDPKNMLSSDSIKFAFDIAMDQRFSMFLLVSLIPGISMMLCAIPMFFYKIAGKEKEDMLAKLAVKREKEGFKVEE
ncbi:MAG: MFS transporter [Clostridia bacterium]|nr:MFS transporter [Clostridia bacterium]